jgi:glyoxylase-like metal-dependent hydrolase (beta-lactamase superfamily II)
MLPAPELSHLPSRSVLWHTYDPASKSELFSTAIADRNGRVLIVDPAPLVSTAKTDLAQLGTVVAIAVTNGNHWRAAGQFSAEFKVPVFSANDAGAEIPGPTNPASSLSTLFDGVDVLPIEGAAPGEIALYFADEGGTLIVGDSLIHFDPYGLALLPKKYCTDQDRMRQSLQRLLPLPFGRLFFAHGFPILNQTKSRLRALLNHE